MGDDCDDVCGCTIHLEAIYPCHCRSKSILKKDFNLVVIVLFFFPENLDASLSRKAAMLDCNKVRPFSSTSFVSSSLKGSKDYSVTFVIPDRLP
jgi:hypothetical protein